MEYLSQRGVPYREIDVSRDRQAASEMVRRTGQQGVPVIAIDDQYIVGFDRPRIDQALAKASASRPSFGAAVADASSARFRQESIPTAGAYVGKVRPDSAAARAGLAAGDVIVELNGRPIRTASELEAAIAGLQPHEGVMVAAIRGGERRTSETRLD